MAHAGKQRQRKRPSKHASLHAVGVEANDQNVALIHTAPTAPPPTKEAAHRSRLGKSLRQLKKKGLSNDAGHQSGRPTSYRCKLPVSFSNGQDEVLRQEHTGRPAFRTKTYLHGAPGRGKPNPTKFLTLLFHFRRSIPHPKLTYCRSLRRLLLLLLLLLGGNRIATLYDSCVLMTFLKAEPREQSLAYTLVDT